MLRYHIIIYFLLDLGEYIHVVHRLAGHPVFQFFFFSLKNIFKVRVLGDEAGIKGISNGRSSPELSLLFVVLCCADWLSTLCVCVCVCVVWEEVVLPMGQWVGLM